MPARNRAAEARRTSSPGTALTLTTAVDAQRLAALLLDPARTEPVAVISTPSHRAEPYVDVQAVLAGMPEGVNVFVLPTGGPSWAFSETMPDLTQVYGGASRVYAPGIAWVDDPYQSPLRFAHSDADSAGVVRSLIADVRRHAGIPAPVRTAWTSETGSTTPATQGLEQRAAELTAELANTHRELNRVQDARVRDEADRRRLREGLRERANADSDPSNDDGLFLDAVEQFKFEVYVAWARRVPAVSKGDHPLGEYVIGPNFLESLDQLDIDRAKVVDVVVEVVTGMDKDLAGRDLHVLRDGVGGAPTLSRKEDGATCWRVALQRGTPSARRLHYWRSVSGVEMSRVALHDDMRP